MKQVTKSSQSGCSPWSWWSGLAGLAGCETNPYTGRSQLLMTSVVARDADGMRRPIAKSKTIRKCTSRKIHGEVEPVRARGCPHHRSGETVRNMLRWQTSFNGR